MINQVVVQDALSAPNPPFSILQPGDLIPADRVEQYEAIREGSM
jgi:hypothetical protein